MGTKIKVWHLITFTAAVTALLIFGVTYHTRTVKRLSRDVEVGENKIEYYEIKVNSLSEYVSEVNANVVESKRQLQLSKAQTERLKQINIRSTTAIGELLITIASMEDSLALYKDSVVIEVVEVPVKGDSTVPMVEVPLSFGFETEWSRTFAAIDIDGKGSAGFEVKSLPIHLTLGSRGVFRKDYVSIVTTPNYEVTVDANNFQIVKQPKWKPLVIGGATGLLLGTGLSLLLLR